MAGIKINDLPALGRDLASTDLFEMSLVGGTGSRKITGQEIMNASKLSVGNTPIVNGAVGKLLFQTTGNVLGETSLFNIDPSNGYLGVGTTTPYFPIDLKFNTLGFYSGPTYYAYLGLNNGSFYLTSYSDFVFGTSVVGNPLTIKQNGNVLINTGTDAGYKLDVNGTARVSGNLFVNTGSTPSSGLIIGDNTTASLLAYYSGGLYFKVLNTDAMTLTSGASGGLYIGAGGLQASYKLDVNGTARVSGVLNVGVTGGAGQISFPNTTSGFVTTMSTAFASNLFRISSGGARIDFNDSLSLVSGGNNIFNNGGTHSISFSVNSSERFKIAGSSAINVTSFTNTNVLINTTTDAGYKLDVNGTFRATVSTETNPFVIQHTNGNYATILIGNGSQLAAGQMGMYFNGTRMWGWNGSVFQLPGAVLGTGVNATTLQIFGGWGGATLGTSIRLGSNSSNQGVFTATTGTQSTVEIGNAGNETWSPSSGNATYNLLNVIPRFNTTGTYSGIARGFYYNPTLTSTTGLTHFAFHSTSGRIRFENLPTSPTGLNAGDLYNDLGTLKIV